MAEWDWTGGLGSTETLDPSLMEDVGPWEVVEEEGKLGIGGYIIF